MDHFRLTNGDDMFPAKGYQFIFRPTMCCNLGCTYCYASKLRDTAHSIMSESEARACIDWMVRYCQYFEISSASLLWHGGEPLLPGVDFLFNTLAYAKSRFDKVNIQLTNQIQTNLLLVEERHIELFKKYFEGSVGFSWDYGSRLRVYPNGKDASDDIWRKALWCKEQGLRLGALCQIATGSRICPEELYRHFSDAEIPFRIGPIFPCMMEAALDAAKIACGVIDAWLGDAAPKIDIGNFRELIEALITGKHNKCYAEKNCGRVLLALSPGGKIYPCSRTTGENDVIGNFLHDAPDVVHRRRVDFYGDKNLEMCIACEYKQVCVGGCPFHRKIGWHECECAYNRRVIGHLADWINKVGYDCV